MTFEETMALLYLAKKLFPRDKSMGGSTREMAEIGEAWTELLQDIPFELGKAAVAAHAASSPYAPAVSEIRAYARKLTEPPRLSADEAWAVALGTIRRYGCSPVRDVATGKFPHERARENTPPEVWRVMELMGYRSMCMSENIDVLRAQFIRAWERQEQVRQEREQLLPFLPEAVKEKVLGIGE
jgi:hypothetical protein